MPSFTNDLLAGLAQATATAGIGTYRSDGSPYLTTETGIGIGDLPTTCDRAIGITDYLNSDDVTQALGVIGVQFWVRGQPNDYRDMKSIADALFGLFQTLTNVDYGTCHVIQMYRASTLPLGQDSNRRSQSAQNWHIDVNVPATAARNL